MPTESRDRPGALARRLGAAFRDEAPLGGYYKDLYKYPARFSPSFVSEAIRLLTKPGDLVLDPFVGGGTTVVEALACGRRAIGIDINPLAHLVSTARTTPLSQSEQDELRTWAHGLRLGRSLPAADTRLRNLPFEAQPFLLSATNRLVALRTRATQHAARAVLLRVGQLAVEWGKYRTWTDTDWRDYSESCVDALISSLEDLISRAKAHGISREELPKRRTLLLGTAQDRLRRLPPVGARLVLTSPPYPEVHVLYHRWQVDGRRETPAPFWIAAAMDGAGEDFYTMGGRQRIDSSRRYFDALRVVLGELHRHLLHDGNMVQVISFSKVRQQLRRFRAALDATGFDPHPGLAVELKRSVPGRRWYTVTRRNDSAREFLLLRRRSPLLR